MAFVLALVFCAVGAALVRENHDNAGTIIATGTVVGLVTAFITGSYIRKKERVEKTKILEGRDGEPDDE